MARLMSARVGLNRALDAQKDKVFLGRQSFEQHVYTRGERCVNDDTWFFNTQSSSQCEFRRQVAKV